MPPGSHQLHSVENANRRLRCIADAALRRDVILSQPFEEYSDFEIGQRATVIPVRPFDFQVKHKLIDKDFDPATIIDPINILGPVLSGHIPVVTSNDPVSLLAAFNKRCNFVQQKEGDDIADHEFQMALDTIAALPDIYSKDPYDENELDRARWLDKFQPAKRQRMVETWARREDFGIKEIRDKTLMVKVETLLKRDDDGWAPRAVYVGSDAHNAITGPAMMVAMERWQKILDDDNDGHLLGPVSVRFAYKRDDVFLVEHLTRDPTLTNTVEGDFSRNDREQRSRVALLVDKVLEKLGFDQCFRDLMIQSSEDYCVYAPQAGLKAWLKHQLPTGTTATTFRNSVFNPLMFSVACQQQRVTRARANVLGDDILAVTMQKINLIEWTNCVDRFKMVLKGMAPRLDGQSTFLSRRIITSTRTPCMVPKVGKALARFNVRACKNPAISDDAYMAGKSLAHAYEFRHCARFVDMFINRFEFHWKNMSQEERDNENIEYDSWFVKISGLTTVKEIKYAAQNCSVVLTDAELFDWLAETYEDLPLDILTFAEQVITSTEYSVLDNGIINCLLIDL
jgi:hypothetical protein